MLKQRDAAVNSPCHSMCIFWDGNTMVNHSFPTHMLQIVNVLNGYSRNHSWNGHTQRLYSNLFKMGKFLQYGGN